MFHFEFITILLAFVLVFVIPSVRTLSGFARLKCKGCGEPFGFRAVYFGKDDSPFEEICVDDKGSLIHNHPACRLVQCECCGQTWRLRHSDQKGPFGPEFSVNPP